MKKDDEDFIEQAKKDFARIEEVEKDNRDRSLEDLRFARLGEQWPDNVRKDREAKGRPCLTVNRMPTFIRQVVNDSRQNRPGIKVHPVDSNGDPGVADVLSGLIRNIEVQSDAEVAYDTGVDQAVSSGIGYWRVDLEYAQEDAFDLDIKINRVLNQFSVYGDPDSKAADSSDWNVAFVTDDMTVDDFKARYPKAKDTVDWQAGDGSKDDNWRGENMIRVAEAFRRTEEERPLVLLSNGQVMEPDELKRLEKELQLAGVRVIREREAKFFKVVRKVITGAEVLESTDWPGKYIPLVPVYGEEVSIEGKRHFLSLIHFGKDPQRIYNYGRSASVEQTSLQPKAPFIGVVGQFATDNAKWASANRDNHAFIEYDPVPGAPPPQRQPPPTPSSGWIQESQIASDDMKSSIGIFNASMGERSNETSGKAIVERKLEGDVSTFHFIDNLSRAIRHTGRIVIDLIPKVYDGPRMLRVLGEDRRESRMVPVNGMEPPRPPAPQGQPPAEPPIPPQVYDLSAGKYDVTVTAGPSFTTRRQEAATQMIELVRAFPQAAAAVGDILAKNLDWPGADEIAERLTALREQPQQAPKEDPVQVAMVKAQADVQAANVKAQGDFELGKMKIKQEGELAVLRMQMETGLAQQKAQLEAITRQNQTPVHPGGVVG